MNQIQYKGLNVQGTVSLAGVQWLQGVEKYSAEQGGSPETPAAEQATSDSRPVLRENVSHRVSMLQHMRVQKVA